MVNASAMPAQAAGTVRLGDLVVQRMGFGAMRVTGAGVWGPPRDREAAKRLLRRALELGVNFLDTADSYGPDVSEETIAEALHPYPQGLVIGTKGAYAVNVFVLGNNRAKSGTARLDDSSLVIGKAKTSAPVGVSVNRVGGLSKELSKVIGHPIRVRSVIAVPGWNVASTDSDKHLLVNEKNVVMLTGWTDPDTYLMDDDVAQIHDYLATRCMNGKQTPN